MTSHPLVTIGLPFVDCRPSYFAGAIKSVYAQTYTNWELVLVADGPIPGLQHLVEAMTAADSRVRMVLGQENRGLATRLNEITNLARGELVMRMDADDIAHPERLHTLVSAMQQQRSIDVIGSHAFLIDADDRILGEFKEPPLATAQSGFLKSNQLTHPTVLARKEWMLRHPYDETLPRSEDKELWLRSFPGTVFEKLETPLLYYRVADLSSSKQARDAAYDRAIIRKYGPRLVGWLQTLRMLAASLTRQLVFLLLVACGCARLIIANKTRELGPGQATAAADGMRRARTGNVPGWSPQAL